MEERYIRLPLSDQLPFNMDFVGLHDDRELGLRIVVNSREGKRYWIGFGRPYAYRSADEGKRLKGLAQLEGGAGIYQIENSSLAEWLHEESGYTRDLDLKSYAVVTINDWIEVVGGEPDISDRPPAAGEGD